MAETIPKPQQLLHGCLEATIFQAAHLHHSLHGHLLSTLEKAEHALHLDILPHSKLYATVDIGIARLARTRMVEYHPQNPAWNESFKLYCAHATSFVTFSVKNQLLVDAELVGRATVAADRLLQSEVVDEWLDLFDDKGEKLHKASIHVRLRFVDAKKETGWGGGLSSIPAFTGLHNCYFPQRNGGEVTLYQNAHLSNSFNPKYHRPARCWEDLYDAISDAKHFVYVVGWSVNASITLVRDPDRMIPGAQKVTIGELLKKKADEGVAVLVMLWDDWTSAPLLQNAGIMETHDQETKMYFDGSKVKCFLCPRKADVDLSAVQKLTTEVQLTHHQKTVTVDAPVAGIGDRRRKVVSFVGGIDISDGRYDNEKHPLFRDLDTLFLNDFQQKNFANADFGHGGPREPWHDAHSKLDGMAAWDVLTNFEQRWIRQAPKEYADNSLVKIKDNPDVFPLPKIDNYSWNTQVFRSIDEASVVGFPFDPSEASRMGLMSGKNVIIDQSIHVGYIEAIRRAKRFIYIENQYFFGSCYAWKESQDCGCLNLVPMEIALKIVSKIRAKERFAVYVLTPMWPEGQPDGDTVQAILHWNHLTMEMMYKMIAEAIDEVGLGGVAHPTDYLNFFCLGNREVQLPGEYLPPKRPEEGTHYWKAQVNRRFLIYVHAKLMIVDDEYVIIGSANLNQRSLDGGRDTEIAHGSYQPKHLNNGDNGEVARGEVYGYRMSLWYEHFMAYLSGDGPTLEVFEEAESLSCVKEVKETAMKLWEMYVKEEVVDLPGHLLPFPVKVARDGSLSELPDNGYFPDTSASVKGKKSDFLPPILTT